MPFAFGRHPGAAAVIRPIVHDRAAFGIWFFPELPVGTFFSIPPALIPLERQPTFRRDWLPLSFGHTVCRGVSQRWSALRAVALPWASATFFIAAWSARGVKQTTNASSFTD